VLLLRFVWAGRTKVVSKLSKQLLPTAAAAAEEEEEEEAAAA
jgi:hypothetical protein